jgi:hypothetical protein
LVSFDINIFPLSKKMHQQTGACTDVLSGEAQAMKQGFELAQSIGFFFEMGADPGLCINRCTQPSE